MPANTSAEIGIRELRASLSDVLNDVSVRGRITYVTSHGRRVAAIVPVLDAEALEAKKQPEGDGSPA
ncbi:MULTISPECIES: type II toxin-antitoxin system prevent-host-death family antitoxin [Streptomyces]|uniref:Antitoxin n=1 Tax=Streptomyces galilaeus TaxID=33899 RepID=A0ABW9IP70_STRGJ